MTIREMLDDVHISESELRDIIGQIQLAGVKSPGYVDPRRIDMTSVADDIRTYYNATNYPIVWKTILAQNGNRSSQFSIMIKDGNGYTVAFKTLYDNLSRMSTSGKYINLLEYIGPIEQPMGTTIIVWDLDYVALDVFNAYGSVVTVKL